jgi:acetyl esterase/lipase
MQKIRFFVIVAAMLIAVSATACRGGVRLPQTALTTSTPTPTNTFAPTPTAAPTPTRASIDVRPGAIDRDITYCAPDSNPQKMDVYFPVNLSDQPMPVIVYIHGGGWSAGDKQEGAGLLRGSGVLARGYLGVSLNYRLAPQYKWPAQIEDVKCAIRYLRANASAYRLDPNRIGVWGSSAGGHLVAMLGAAGPSAGFDVGEYADQSSRVQAVVDMFGPADLTTLVSAPAAPLGESVFGATSRGDPVLTRASPVTYVAPGDPPFLILQGDQDKTVPPSQSQEMYDRLKAAGVPATLVMVKNAGHSFTPTGGAISPTLPQILKIISDFFDANLR